MDDLVSRQKVLRCIKESRENIDWGQSEDGDAFLHYSAALYRTIASKECLPSAQPEYHFDEWCTECKEYDQERHRCPRFNAVIRTAIEEMEADRKNGEWIDAPVYKQTQNGKTWDGYTYCSVCKEMHEYGYRSKFCPDCGTKMEGRKES